MTETNDQLTRGQLAGMIAMGLCVWAVILGLVYAAWKDLSDGLIVAGTGAVGVAIFVRWLIAINPENRRSR